MLEENLTNLSMKHKSYISLLDRFQLLCWTYIHLTKTFGGRSYLYEILFPPSAECTPCSNSNCSRLLCEHPTNTRLLSAGQFLPCHSAIGYFRPHSTNSRKQKSRQNALKSRAFSGRGVQNKNANFDTHCIKISVLMWQRRGESNSPS